MGPLVLSVLALSVSGCGGSIKSSGPQQGGTTVRRPVADQLTSQSCSASLPSTGGPEVGYCEFVLPDRHAFKCNMASLGTSTPTAAEVEGDNKCVGLGLISVPTASASGVAAIAKAKACLEAGGLPVKGGPVPPEGHGPGGPEGELNTGGALIAFYADRRTAEQAESEVLREARRLGGTVEHRGAVTVLWLAKQAEKNLGARVGGCVFG